MTKTKIEKIETIDEQIAKLLAQRSKLEKAQKEEERIAKAKRINERGEHFEIMLPETINLTFEQFKSFLDKTLLMHYSQKILKELLPPEPVVEPEREGETAQAEETETMLKSEKAAQGKVTSIPSGEGNSTQQAS